MFSRFENNFLRSTGSKLGDPGEFPVGEFTTLEKFFNNTQTLKFK